MVITGGRFIYASALRLLLLKFILSMSASKDVLAMASLEVDLANIEPGNTITVKWRGKPVFIRRRTEADILKANEVNLAELRDPQVPELPYSLYSSQPQVHDLPSSLTSSQPQVSDLSYSLYASWQPPCTSAFSLPERAVATSRYTTFLTP